MRVRRTHVTKTNVGGTTVDLSAYPDLVVIYLGMRVKSRRGLGTIIKLGPQINQAARGNAQKR